MANKRVAVYLRTFDEDIGACEEYYLDTPSKGALPDCVERVTKASTDVAWQQHWCDALNAYAS
jgi:hypothetical protein